MRVLIVGAWGMLGRKLTELLTADHDLTLTDSSPDAPCIWADITDQESISTVVTDANPEVIVNCAAYTNVDACEENAELAHAVNGTGPGNIARAAEAVGAHLIHISTDYVFDGESARAYTEDDPTRPLSVYGRSKLEGEESVQEHCTKWSILRTQWLFGEHGANFAETMIRLAGKNPTLRVVDDQFGTPTYTGDLSLQILAIMENGATGIFHTSCGGEASWFEFARAVLDRSGLQHIEVIPVTTSEFPRPATRPARAILQNRALERSIGDSMRPWQQALDEYISRRSQS